MDDDKYLPILPAPQKFEGIRVVNATVDELMSLKNHRRLMAKGKGAEAFDRVFTDESQRGVYISAKYIKKLEDTRIPRPDLQILQQQEIDGKIQVYEGGAPEMGAMRYFIPWHKIKDIPAYFQVLVPSGHNEGYGRNRIKARITHGAEKNGFVCRFIVTGAIMTVTIIGRCEKKKD